MSTESESSASCLGSIPPWHASIGSEKRAFKSYSRLEVRERSMSRHTRATTVVSHPPRFSTPLVSEPVEP